MMLQFKPQSVQDLSLITAALRPSGASYRDELLARKTHKNVSPMIDKLLEKNNGFLVYQEDVSKFLQDICGLSGSAADTIRRAIADKKEDKIEKALPEIIEGYCSKSPQPREVAEQEVKEFLQILKDASRYMFGYNHACAYSILTYYCAYMRYYYPIEFITSFLNNAQNDDDITNGTELARMYGIRISNPKWGVSRGNFFFDRNTKTIYKGLASLKNMGADVSEELYQLSQNHHYESFMELLFGVVEETTTDSRQLDILVKIDFFSQFGNQRELLRMIDVFNLFKKGNAKKIKRETIDGTPLEPIVRRYATDKTKAGTDAKSYTLLNVKAILLDAERHIKSCNMNDLSDTVKVRNVYDIMGYAGYTSGKEQDRPKLYIVKIFPLHRKKDGKHFGYSFITRSIGSGKESRFTVFNAVYNKLPVKEGDIIFCKSYTREGKYFTMQAYDLVV